MPETPRELIPDAVQKAMNDVHDDKYGYIQKILIILSTLLLTNPMTLVAVGGIGCLVYLVTKGNQRLEDGQRAVVGQMQAAYEAMETRRELREEKGDSQRAAAIDRLSMALDRNTDAVRGRVFLPKTSGENVKKSGEKGP